MACAVHIMIQDIIHAIILFGAGLALLISLVQLLQPVRDRKALLLFLIFFSITLLQLFFYLQVYSTGGIQTIILAEYLFGPGVYLFYQSIFNHSYKFNGKSLIHFLPAAFLVGGAFIFTLFSGFFPENNILNFIREMEIFVFIQSGGVIIVILYLLVLLYRMQPLNIAAKGRPGLSISIALIMIILFLTVMLLLLASLFRKEIFLTKVSMVLTSLVVIYWFVMSQLYPALFFRGVSKKRKKKKNNEVEESFNLQTKLEQLLKEEKLFCDEDLTLAKLALLSDVTLHQLSAYLNTVQGMNFNQFINGYRIDEAIKMMKDEPKRSLLSIAFAVGFNSKSSFYEVFSRATGQSPAKYRQNL